MSSRSWEGGRQESHQQTRSEYAKIRKKVISKNVPSPGIWPGSPLFPFSLLQSKAGATLGVLLGVLCLLGERVSVPGRRGAHARPHGQRWVVAAVSRAGADSGASVT